MSSKKKPELFLVCTGLGRVQRGFESYINSLAEKLTLEDKQFQFTVYLGKRISNVAFKQQPVFNLHRGLKIFKYLGLLEHHRFAIEQFSFCLGIFPFIFLRKPKAIYLGEYNLYCYLYKLRKLFKLKFTLVLYTGGQAAPGLFDNSRDFVHHVTDVYYQMLLDQGIPALRQFILPHFVFTDFIIDHNLVKELQTKAKGKKIILSVGQIDLTIKRMQLIPELFSELAHELYPIIVGAETDDTKNIIQKFTNIFGSDGYLMIQVPRNKIGNYYAAADFFILCSNKESFGYAFVEALSFNLPIICHDFQEAHFVLKQNANYLNFNYMDESKKWINNNLQLLHKMSNDNGRDFVFKNYSWDKLKNRYIDMFNTILVN